jgi:hypothetical protein
MNADVMCLSPRKIIVSPKRTVVSPKRTVVSPKRTVVSPKRTVVSPKRTVVSPKMVFVVDDDDDNIDMEKIITNNTNTDNDIKKIIADNNADNDNDMEEQHLQNCFESEKNFMLNEGYMNQNKNINNQNRKILIDWLFQYCTEEKLLPETFFMTVMLVDQYINKSFNLEIEKLQLLGIICCWIASKFNEIQYFTIKDCIYVCANTYNSIEIKNMEIEILTKLNWNINIVTPYHFLKYFINTLKIKLLREEYFINLYILEFSYHYCELMHFKPSTLASSSIYLTLKIIKKLHLWTDEFLTYSQQNINVIKNCSVILETLLKKEMAIFIVNKKTKFFITEHYSLKKMHCVPQKIISFYTSMYDVCLK